MEFQAVVLAGGTGTRLYPLTDGVPKCMLSMANRPLLSYQLDLLERSGFKEALVATSERARDELDNYLAQGHKGSISVDIQIVSEDLETADVLRAIKDKIRKDFLVISGDLVTDIYIHHLADVHRINDASCTVLLRAPKPEQKQPGGKPAKVEGATIDYVGLDEKRSRLLCLESAADIEEKLVLSRRMLTKHPNITVTNKMLDAHCYIFNYWVLELLTQTPELTSIKTELIPFLVKNQYSSNPIPGQPKQIAGDDGAVDESLEIGEEEQKEESFVPIKCHAMVYDGGYCNRADSMHTYKEMNFEIPRHHGHSVPWQHQSSFPDKTEEEKKVSMCLFLGLCWKTPVKYSLVQVLYKKVGSDCVVAEGFTIGEKCRLGIFL